MAPDWSSSLPPSAKRPVSPAHRQRDRTRVSGAAASRLRHGSPRCVGEHRAVASVVPGYASRRYQLVGTSHPVAFSTRRSAGRGVSGHPRRSDRRLPIRWLDTVAPCPRHPARSMRRDRSALCDPRGRRLARIGPGKRPAGPPGVAAARHRPVLPYRCWLRGRAQQIPPCEACGCGTAGSGWLSRDRGGPPDALPGLGACSRTFLRTRKVSSRPCFGFPRSSSCPSTTTCFSMECSRPSRRQLFRLRGLSTEGGGSVMATSTTRLFPCPSGKLTSWCALQIMSSFFRRGSRHLSPCIS